MQWRDPSRVGSRGTVSATARRGRADSGRPDLLLHPGRGTDPGRTGPARCPGAGHPGAGRPDHPGWDSDPAPSLLLAGVTERCPPWVGSYPCLVLPRGDQWQRFAPATGRD